MTASYTSLKFVASMLQQSSYKKELSLNKYFMYGFFFRKSF